MGEGLAAGKLIIVIAMLVLTILLITPTYALDDIEIRMQAITAATYLTGSFSDLPKEVVESIYYYVKEQHPNASNPNEYASLVALYARALGFPAREITIALGNPGPIYFLQTYSQGAAAEVWYDDAWHFFDPFNGITDQNKYFESYTSMKLWYSDIDQPSGYNSAITPFGDLNSPDWTAYKLKLNEGLWFVSDSNSQNFRMLYTDNQGRRTGQLEDGTAINEISGAIFTPDGANAQIDATDSNSTIALYPSIFIPFSALDNISDGSIKVFGVEEGKYSIFANMQKDINVLTFDAFYGSTKEDSINQYALDIDLSQQVPRIASMSVSLIYPFERQVLPKSFEAEWEVGEDNNADYFEIFLDGMLLGTTTDLKKQIDDLPEGWHTFEIRAYKGVVYASNSADFFIDGTPPEIIIIEPQEKDYSYTQNISTSFSADDLMTGISSLAAELDGADVNNNQTIDLKDFALGRHTFDVRAADRLFNEATKTIIFNVIDDAVPVSNAKIASGTIGNNSWYTSDATIAIDANDAKSGIKRIEYNLDGSDKYNDYSAPIAVSSEGETTVYYRAEDNAGNIGETKQLSVKIDKTTPQTADNAPEGWQANDVSVKLTATDATSGIAKTLYRINSGEWIEGAAVALTESGEYTIEYYSEDAAGNKEEIKIARNIVKIDKIAPITIDNATTGWVNHTVSVALTASDAHSGVAHTYYKINDASEFAEGTAIELTEDGEYFISYYSVDNVGNVEEVKQSVEVQIDKTNPAVSDNYASSGAWVNADQAIGLNANDNLSGIAEVKYCTGAECMPEIALAAPYELTYTTDQDTIVRYSATDNAGNSSDVGEFNIKFDKTKPVTTDNAQTGWVNTDVVVALAPTDNLSGVAKTNYSINSGTLQEGNKITLAETGKYVIDYYSIDAAGNIEDAKHSATVQIDKILPVIAITSPEAKDYSYTVDFMVQYSGSDEISGVAGASAEIDGISVENAQSIDLFGYAVGKHTFTANAADLASNSKTEQVEFNVIDDVAPITGDNADKEWHNSNIAVTLTAADEKSNVAAIHYIVNSGAEQIANCSSKTCTADVLIDYENNGNAIEYWAVDEYGNAEEHKHVSEIKLDKTAPEISEDYDGLWHKENFSINIASADPTIQGTPSGLVDTGYELYIAGVSQGARKLSEAPMPFIDYEDDSTRLVYWAEDVAGNREEKTVESIKLDKTAPTASNNADTAWHRENISITLNSNDPITQGDPSEIADVYYIIYRDEIAQEARSANANGMPVIDYEDNDNWVEYWPTDIAGNEGLHTTRKEIKLDKTAPETANDYDNLWHNANFNVNLSASDAQIQGIPSGVAETHYRVYIDELPSAAKALSADGSPLIDYEDNDTWVEYWSADVAGNEEAHNFTKEIKLDKTAPQVELSIAPQDKYYTTDPLPVDYLAIDPQVQGTPSNNLNLQWSIDGSTIDNPNANPIACSHTLTLTATDLAGNSSGRSVEYEAILKLVGEAQLKITPETLNVNPGTLTAHAEFPLPYSAYSITGAYADYAAMGQLAGDNMKFSRQDIESALASRGLRLDTHFEVWGEFLHNGQTCKFEGADDITAVEPDEGSNGRGRR